MSLKICVLGSGSGGNCTAIWTNKTGLFIDAGGLDPNEIEKSLQKRNVSIRNFKGIIVTHGHSDHIGGTTEEISRKYEIPIYAHKKTISAARKRFNDIGYLENRQLIRYFSHRTLRIGDLRVRPFPVPHSGSGNPGEPFGFCIFYKNYSKILKIGFITDLGSVPVRIINCLRGCKAIIIETNHDEVLVKNGSRFNKGWLLSPEGHLSNFDAGKAILKLINCSGAGQKLCHIFLAHISRDHNTPRRALRQIKESIGKQYIKNLKFNLTYQNWPSRVVQIEN